MLPPERRAALASFRAANATSVGSTGYCLREAPRYRAADIDPDINAYLQTFVGLDEPDGVLAAAEDSRLGYFPPASAAVRVNSLWDSLQAPGGCHVAGADTIFPSLRSMDDGTLVSLENSYAHALLECWEEYAPNMTGDNLIAAQFSLSRGSERKLLLAEGDDQYRMGIAGLYLCGAETYPGGGVHGACAFNAARTIAKDRCLSP